MKEEVKIIKENYMVVDYNSLGTIAEEAYETLGLEKSKEIREEIGLMITEIAYFEIENSTLPIREFLIKIESPTAKFLLSYPRKSNILGVDAYISYENVVASYLNAIKTHNSKMANKIESLLKERIFGFVSEFQEKYEYSVLEYIKLNGDLQAFLEGKKQLKRVRNIYQIDDIEYDEYIVFENGKVFIAKVKKSLSMKKEK